MKTLYVTDLDGTLMHNDKSVSPGSVDIINKLIEKGMYFTYATARSIYSSHKITKDLQITLPVINRNGAVISEHELGKEVEVFRFSTEAVEQIRHCMEGLDLYGYSTSYINGENKKTYLEGHINEGFREYLIDHARDTRIRAVKTLDQVFEGDLCYFTFIDTKENLDPFYERLLGGKEWVLVYQKDTYREEYWLEICPKDATKASAIKKLQKQLKCDKIVVFGDSLNDIPMFQMADEAYAVENAMEELKQYATGIIESNEADGVAKWLLEHVQ